MTDNDIRRASELLKQFEPGFLPYPIFEQIARLVALPIIEFVPLRHWNNRTEVLLIERPADDMLWPGMLHTPGTVIRATDISDNKDENWQAFQRIIHEELQDTEIGPPHYVGSIFHQSKRGAEQAQLYWVEVKSDPKIGTFYSVDTVPDSLIESQQIFITEASRHFNAHS